MAKEGRVISNTPVLIPSGGAFIIIPRHGHMNRDGGVLFVLVISSLMRGLGERQEQFSFPVGSVSPT